MHTHVASSAAQPTGRELTMTTDIDVTADLADPHAASTMPAPTWVPPTTDQSRPREVATATAQPEPRLPLAPGRVLRDRYVLTQIIGTGGMCTVFRARDLEAQGGQPAFVALKTPRPDYPDRARAIERLKREFESARGLSHTSIVQVYELGCDGDIWFMTMELLEGESLASIVRRQASALAPQLVRRALKGIGEALGYAHAGGVAHGDLNLANVFVLSGDRIKLIDFAAACKVDDQPAAAATLAYASPQVLEGCVPDIRDDIFSFACIAFEISTGRHPFEQRPATAAREAGIRPEAPPNLSSEQALALMSALAFEREARPNDIKVLARTLSPDPQRIRTVMYEDDFDAPLEDAGIGKGWWYFAAACAVAMIVSVALTRLG
jgi:serine/threonine protein kinase